jgi:hypothetical protein
MMPNPTLLLLALACLCHATPESAQKPLLHAKEDGRSKDFWTSGLEDASTWTDNEKLLRKVPKYVMDYAPYVHLFSKEEFWPCDMAEHFHHTTPHLNYTPVAKKWRHQNLTTLGLLNKFGRHVFLKSDDNVEERPEWLEGSSNIPEVPSIPIDDFDHFPGRKGPWGWLPGQNQPAKSDPDFDKWWHVDADGEEEPAPSEGQPLDEERPALSEERSAGGRSDAPAVLVVVDKGKGVVDAFWFFFYSYNLGNKVFNVRFGNHVGDWEHTVIRFYNGEPKAMFFSEHNFGAAYSWEAVEKIGDRVSAPSRSDGVTMGFNLAGISYPVWIYSKFMMFSEFKLARIFRYIPSERDV